jgi:hypothetical protein
MLTIQLRYTKFCYFSCEWDCRARNSVTEFPRRKQIIPWQNNTANDPPVYLNKTVLRLRQIKL